MDCSLAIDIVALIVSIGALCVTIWIGITAQSFAKMRASKEDEGSKELTDTVKEFKEEFKNQSEENARNVMTLAKEKIEKDFENNLEPIITNVEDLKKEMNNIYSKIDELKNLTIRID